MTISRRTFLGWMGAAGMSTAFGKRANAAAGKQFKGYPDSMGVLFDLRVTLSLNVSLLSTPQRPGN